MARKKPVERMRKRMNETVPVDTTGMDPEMATLMKQEQARIMKMKLIGSASGKDTMPKGKAKKGK